VNKGWPNYGKQGGALWPSHRMGNDQKMNSLHPWTAGTSCVEGLSHKDVQCHF
jgi:hypothetical protein